MNRLRFSIAQLMAVIFYFGFGFAALRNGGVIWASLTFDLAIISIAAAIVAPRWEGQGPHVMCRICDGWWDSSGRLDFPPAPVGSLYGPPLAFLYQFQAYINPVASGGAPLIWYVQISMSLDVLLVGVVGGVVGHFIAMKKDRPNL